MSDLSGTGVTYRTLQAICDLRFVARSASAETQARIAAGTDSPAAAQELDLLIGEDGCRITRPESARLHQALILAAALPDDDADAFRTATAILIADRLQRGGGSDDLFWHWDAFHVHYGQAPDHVRAALMQGYLRMDAEDLVALEDPPRGPVIATEKRTEILGLLDASDHESAAAILAALKGAEIHEGFWTRHCKPLLGNSGPPVVLRGIRHLLETRLDWDPQDNLRFDPTELGLAVLPVIRSA